MTVVAGLVLSVALIGIVSGWRGTVKITSKTEVPIGWLTCMVLSHDVFRCTAVVGIAWALVELVTR